MLLGTNNFRGAIECKLTEEHLRELEGKLLQAQKMEVVGLLASGIAHDFNNILTAIIGCGNVLQMEIGKDDPLRANVDQILASAERAKGLSRRLLSFGMERVSDLRPVNINSVIDDVKNLLTKVIREDIELKVSLSNEELIAMADTVQIEQLLFNLCINAGDAMASGGILSIKTESAKLDDEIAKAIKPRIYAVISIADTGSGIDKNTREKMFNPFFTTKVGKGTGLGLSIVNGIVELHKGFIRVDSEVGKGTVFNIYIPMAESKIE